MLSKHQHEQQKTDLRTEEGYEDVRRNLMGPLNNQ
jgi:hypothetical protein